MWHLKECISSHTHTLTQSKNHTWSSLVPSQHEQSKGKQKRETRKESFLPLVREKKAIKGVWCHTITDTHV